MRTRSPLGRLALVHLEDRVTPATFVVTTAEDNGSDTAPVPGSLRAAVVQANSTAGADVIAFNIPGGGVKSIDLRSQLPAVIETVTIDGTTQPGYTVGSPTIRLNGTAAGANAAGLRLVNHAGSVVEGLAVGRFAGTGVAIQGGSGHKLLSNLIGLAPGGNADPNGIGVLVASASGVVVGGTTDAGKNVISGNAGDAVLVRDAAAGTQVAGNFIGTDVSGQAAVGNGGNGVTVAAGARSTTVGGAGGGGGNLIAGNKASGVRVADPATAGTVLVGNRIGLNLAGSPLPNGGDGVRVEAAAATAPAGGVNLPSTQTLVQSNTIQQNTGAGVAVRDTARFVRIDGNSIGGNAGGGITVAAGANGGVMPPQLSGLASGVGTQTLTGRVPGAAGSKFTVTVYSNSSVTAAGVSQAENPLGTVTATADGGGFATFTFTVPADTAGGFLTATATGAQGDTSALSNTLNRSTAVAPGRTLVVGTGAGEPRAIVYTSGGQALSSPTVFDATMTGGVRVASADFNNDGVLDLVVGTGPGSVTRVRVLDGNSGAELFAVQPFEDAFTGGVFVAAGDVNGDGTPDLVISPDLGGGPRLDVYSGVGFGKMASFFAFQDDPNFRGGARAAVGDLDGDGDGDVIVSAGFGGGPRIAGFDGRSVAAGSTNPTRVFADFFVFEDTLRNGAFVATGDVDGEGRADLIFGGGPGGGPRVTVICGHCLVSNNNQRVLANFFAGDTSLRGGVRVAGRDLDGDGKAEVITGDGPGGEGAARLFDGADLLTNPAPVSRLVITAFTDSADGVFVG